MIVIPLQKSMYLKLVAINLKISKTDLGIIFISMSLLMFIFTKLTMLNMDFGGRTHIAACRQTYEEIRKLPVTYKVNKALSCQFMSYRLKKQKRVAAAPLNIKSDG